MQPATTGGHTNEERPIARETEARRADKGNVGDAAEELIGRHDEMDRLVGHVDHGEAVVGLIGPPGSGKSRLAIEFARRDTDRDVPGGRWIVDLAGCTSQSEMVHAIATTLGLPWDEAGSDAAHGDRVESAALEGFWGALAARGPHLVVLDGLDRLADARVDEFLLRWSATCPQSILLVTSRSWLSGVEASVEVGPLHLEDAVALFAARAGADAANDREAVERLVEQLDRLPLAIVLAAARASVLGPGDLFDRLNRRFTLLRSSGHQRALEDAIAWSWEALGERQQNTLIQTCVFAAPFDVDAAEAIVELSGEGSVVDALESLVAHSMLCRRATEHGRARFVHYESIREYARSRPEAAPSIAEARTRHTRYFLSLAKSWRQALERGEPPRAGAIACALPELTLVFRDSLTHAPHRAAELALAIAPFLLRSATGAILRTFLDEVLAVTDDSQAQQRAELLLGRGELDVAAGRLDGAASALMDAMETSRNVCDRSLEAKSTFRLGDVERRRGRPREALVLLAQASEAADAIPDPALARCVAAHLACCHIDLGARDRARELLVRIQASGPTADARDEADILRRMAYVQFYLGNFEEQHRLGELALERARQARDLRLEAVCIHGLGDSALRLESHDEALRHYERALPMHRELGDEHFAGVLLGNLGTLHHQADRFRQAGACYREALEIHRRSGARPNEVVVSFALGALQAERGRIEEARHHYGVARELADELELFDDLGAVELAGAWIAMEEGDFSAARSAVDAAVSAFARVEDEAWRAIAVVAADLLEVRRDGGGLVAERVAVAREKVLSFGGETEATLFEVLEILAAVMGVAGDAESARARLDAIVEDRPAAQRSLHVRILLRLTRRSAHGVRHHSHASLDHHRVDESLSLSTLRVGEGARWFEYGNSSRVDLRRRRTIRLLLDELIRRQRADAVGIDVYEAFDVGWPGETASPEAAADRVYWAIGTLRKLGLDDAIVTTDAGYHLDPAVKVEVVSV